MVDEGKLPEHQTQGYRPPPPYWSSLIDSQRLPVWTYQWAEAMESTPQVILGLAVGNAPLYQAEIEVECDVPEVAEFIAEQWSKLWTANAKKFLACKRAGYGGLEVVYQWDEEKQHWCIDSLFDFHPLDIKPLTQDGAVVGFSVRNNRVKSDAPIQLLGPKAIWLKYDSSYGGLYGRSINRGAFEPWWEKTKPSGGSDLRRLKYIKDSWIGDVGRYPLKNEKIERQDGSGSFDSVSGHDILRDMLSQRSSGGILMLPSETDDKGKYIYDYAPPVSIAGGSDILAYGDKLDSEIWKGLLVPKEVIEAATTGSGFSGRSIPMMSFLSIRDIEMLDYVAATKHVFEYLVESKWGNVPFQIKPKPLIEKFAESTGGTPAGGPIGGASQPAAFDPNAKSGLQFATDNNGAEHSEADGKFVSNNAGDTAKKSAKKKPYSELTDAELDSLTPDESDEYEDELYEKRNEMAKDWFTKNRDKIKVRITPKALDREIKLAQGAHFILTDAAGNSPESGVQERVEKTLAKKLHPNAVHSFGSGVDEQLVANELTKIAYEQLNPELKSKLKLVQFGKELLVRALAPDEKAATQFALADESVMTRAGAAGIELGSQVRRQIRTALKKNYPQNK